MRTRVYRESAGAAGVGLPLGRRRVVVVGLVLLALIAVVGLAWAKWVPYTGRTQTLLNTHTWAGSSIFTSADGGTAPSIAGAWAFTRVYIAAVWPAAVVGIVLASALESFVPRGWVVRLLSRRAGWRQGVLGGLAALPTMMCTCCTAPVASSLRRRGVPIGASVAYWLGNPLLNPAVLVFLALTLPWPFTAVRLAVGAVVVLGAAVLAAWVAPDGGSSSRSVVVEGQPGSVPALLGRFVRTLARYTVILVPEYLLLVFLTGWLSGVLSNWAGLGDVGGPVALLVVGLVGAALVIPTGGEIPVIVGLVAAGASMGVAGTLLITLPALSVPSLVMVGRSFGWRALSTTTLVVVTGGILAGGLLLLLS